MAAGKGKDRKKREGITGKLTGLAVVALFIVFFCGHLSAVIEAGAGMDTWSELLLEHIRITPMDFLHVNGYVAYFTACIYTLIFVMSFSKTKLPEAEMKGMEHGSNDFQTEEERLRFLADNTSPIYSLDLHEFLEKKG